MSTRWLFALALLLLSFAAQTAHAATQRDFYVQAETQGLGFNANDIAIHQTSSFRIEANSANFDPASLSLTDDADWLEATLDPVTRQVTVTVDARFGLPLAPGTSHSPATITLQNASGSAKVEVTLYWGLLAYIHTFHAPDPATGRFIGITPEAILVFDAQARPLKAWNHRLARFSPPFAGSSRRYGIAYDKTGLVLDLAALTLETHTLPPALAALNYYDFEHTAPGPDGLLYFGSRAQPGMLRAYDPASRELVRTYSVPVLTAAAGLPFRFATAPFAPRLDVNLGHVPGTPRRQLASSPMSAGEDGACSFGQAETTPLTPGVAITYSTHPFLTNADGTVFACGYALWRETADGPRLLRNFDNTADSLVRAISPDGHFYATNRAVRTTADDRLVFALSPVPGYTSSPTVHAFAADGRSLIVTTANKRFPHLIEIVDSASPSAAPLLAPADGISLTEGAALRWGAVPGAGAYRLHLGPDSLAELPLLLATTATEASPAGLTPGLLHRWRVDAVFGGQPVRGAEQTFTPRPATVADLPAALRVLPGLATQSLRFTIHAATPDTPWSLSGDQAWLSLSPAAGQGSASVTLNIDASALDDAAPLAARVLLATAAGAEEHVLSVTPAAPDFISLQLVPGTTRALALNRQPDAPNQLVEADLATGAFLRAVAVGQADTFTVSADGADVFVLDPLANTITRLASSGLAPTAPPIALSYPLRDGRRLGPAGPARFALYQDALAQIFSPADGPLAEHSTYNTATQRYSDDGLVRFAAESVSGQATVRRLAPFASAPVELSSSPVTVPAYPRPAPVLLPDADGSRVHFDGLVFDATLALVGSRGDEIVALAPGDATRFGRHLAYPANAPASPRLLPAHRSTPILASAEGLLGYITLEGDLAVQSLDDLPAAPRPQARVLTLESYALSFAVADAAAYPAGTRYRFEYRPAAGDAPWRVAATRDADTVGVLNPLDAKTDYLLRVQAYAGSSALTDWSEPLLVRTLIAPPTLSDRADQLPLQPGAMVDTIIQVNGENTTVSLENLPPGLHYDQATRRLTGVFFPDHNTTRHDATLIATNAGGTLRVPFLIYHTSYTPAAPVGTYQGLIEGAKPHLDGFYRVTFTGDKLTGLYRGPLGDVSFSGRLIRDPSNWPYSPPPAPYLLYERKLSARDTLYFRLEWVAGQDRVILTVDDTSYYGTHKSTTTRHTGYASRWHKDSRPLPQAGLHTALLLPDDTDSYLHSPRPYGVGFVRVNTRPDGRADIVGETATGHPFTLSTQVSTYRVLPLFARHGAHTHRAELRLDPVSAQIPSLSGDWHWEATPSASPAYPYGIRETLTAVGAPLPAVVKGGPTLDPLANPSGQAELLLSGGGLSRLPSPPGLLVGVGPSGFVLPAAGSSENPQRVALSLAPATGLLTGSATLADPVKSPPVARSVKLRGQLVKDPLHDGRDLVGGYLLFPDAKGLAQSARLELTEPAAAPESAPAARASLSVKTYSAGVQSSGSSGVIIINPPITPITPDPVNQVTASPGSVYAITVPGVPPPAQTLRLTAAAGVSWTLASDQPWLVPSLTAGSGDADITLAFDSGSLPVGEHSAKLTLSDGVVSTSLAAILRVKPLSIVKLADDPGAARAFAISRDANNALLLKIDAADGRILRAVPIPRSTDNLVVHAADSLLYLSDETGKSIAARSLDTLEPVRAFSYATLPAEAPHPDALLPRRLFAGRSGRLLVEFAAPQRYQIHALRWLDTSTGELLDSLGFMGDPSIALHASGDRLFVHGRPSPLYYTYRLLTYDLASDLFTTVVGVTPNLTPDGVAVLPPGPEPRLYLADRKIYDRDLHEAGATPEPIFAASADETILVARHVAYVRGEMRPLPAATLRIYNTAARRILSANTTSISVSDPETLPAATPVTLSVTEVGDTWVDLAWSSPSTDTYIYAQTVIQSRLVGATQWTDRYVYGSLAQNRQVRVTGNTPESTLEFRIRFTHEGGYYQPFSEPVAATFLIRRPEAPFTSKTYGQVFADAEADIHLPFSGAAVDYAAEGLPPGLRFDPDTRRIVGATTIPGRYQVEIRATNIAGFAVQQIELLVRAHTTRARGARYTGVLGLDGGPLIGVWSATRSLDQITGAYRTPLFNRPFKVELRSDGVTEFSRGATKIFYNGVPIHLSLVRDHATDRLTLRAETHDLIENFTATTVEDSGLPTHWWGGTLPYPKTGRHTALLIPGDGAGPLLPEGAGFLRLDINADGLSTLVGETALGRPVTQSAYVSDFHSLPVFHFAGDSFVLGHLELPDPSADLPPLVGSLFWAKDTNRRATAYRDGFEQELFVVGAPLPATGKNLPPLAPLANSAGAADLVLADGGLARLSKPILQTLAPGPSGFAVPKPGSAANPHRVTVKLDPATGLVTGSAAILDARGQKTLRTVNFRGMLLKNPFGDGEDIVGGHFLLPDAQGVLRSGRLEITEPGHDDPTE